MANGEAPRVQGVVTRVLANARFSVRLENDHEITAQVDAGRSRPEPHPGDRVIVEMLPNDLTAGRIVHRFRTAGSTQGPAPR